MQIVIDFGEGYVVRHTNVTDVVLDEFGNLHVTSENGGSIYHHTTWLSVDYTKTNDKSGDQ